MLIIVTSIPIISGEYSYEINFNEKVDDEDYLISENQIEISIYGTIYMIINKPLGQMLGLYGTFKNNGQNSIDAYFGLHIKTTSTVPWDQTINTEESLTLPAGSLAEMPMTAPLGIGLFTITYFMEGTGDDEGFYIEKSASGLCFGFFQFVLTGD